MQQIKLKGFDSWMVKRAASSLFKTLKHYTYEKKDEAKKPNRLNRGESVARIISECCGVIYF